MITRFLTSVSTAFSPFNPKSGKTARNFLALLPPNARTTMKIDIKQLPRADAAKPALLALKFSTALLHSPLTRSLLTRNYRGRQRDEPRLGDVEDQGYHDRSRPTLAHARQKRRAGWLIRLIAYIFNFTLHWEERGVTVINTTHCSTSIRLSTRPCIFSNVTSNVYHYHCIQHITQLISRQFKDRRYTGYVQFLFRCL